MLTASEQEVCHTPAAITYSPAVRLHANPSDWIEKRPFENGLFSWLPLLDHDLLASLGYDSLRACALLTHLSSVSLRPNGQVSLAVRMTASCKHERQTLSSVALRAADCQPTKSLVEAKREKAKQEHGLLTMLLFWLPLLDLNQRLPD